MSFNFQGHKVILKHLSPKEVHEDQIKMKKKEKMEKIKKEKINRVIISHLTLQKKNHVDLCQNTNCTSKVFFLVFFIT